MALINNAEWDAEACAVMRALDLEAVEELRNEASRCIHNFSKDGL